LESPASRMTRYVTGVRSLGLELNPR
jgi:hypothetical protein